MELINHTAFPALMFKTGIDDNKYAMSVAVRVTYDIVDGSAIQSGVQEWKLDRQLWQSEYGPLESDDVFKRGVVDILVFGSARPADAVPVKSMNVEVRLNQKILNRISIFGDRVWQKSIFGMEMSVPKPFTEMPLTLSNAFGGNAEWDGLVLPHASNPYGKGYYYAKEDCIGQPLPNIEDPDKLIKKWSDRPDPVGVGCLPGMCELHMRNNINFDKEGKITGFNPKFYNTAFPSMMVDKLNANDHIEITGMSKRPFVFKIPDENITMHVSMNERQKEWKMYIEQVGLIVDKQQAFITYRNPINYTVTPMETRKCEIFNN